MIIHSFYHNNTLKYIVLQSGQKPDSPVESKRNELWLITQQLLPRLSKQTSWKRCSQGVVTSGIPSCRISIEVGADWTKRLQKKAGYSGGTATGWNKATSPLCNSSAVISSIQITHSVPAAGAWNTIERRNQGKEQSWMQKTKARELATSCKPQTCCTHPAWRNLL